MDPLCDFCGAQRAMVYCRSDSACLCFSCDVYIHAANALSRRHLRAPVCDRCGSQAAIVRCLEDKVSLCQNCDWNGCLGIGPGHQRETMNCYSGCPSLAELSRFWSCIFYSSSLNEEDVNWPGWKIMPTNESSVNNRWEQGENSSVRLNGLDSSTKFGPWMSTSSEEPNADSVVCGGDQLQVGLQETNLSKVGCPPFKDLRNYDDDEFCEGFNVDDVGLNFDNSDELFGCPQSNSIYPYEDVGMDGILMEKNFSVGDSDGPNENITEASSSGQHGCMMTLQSSRAVATVGTIQAVAGCSDQVLFNPNGNTNINLSFPSGQVHPSISLSVSNLTGESNVADYQDCGVSPIFLSGESPWESNLEASGPQARDKAKMRYNEKKKARTFGKQIRYASRKVRADTRKRVKGRFVKAGEAYDYDPLVSKSG